MLQMFKSIEIATRKRWPGCMKAVFYLYESRTSAVRELCFAHWLEQLCATCPHPIMSQKRAQHDGCAPLAIVMRITALITSRSDDYFTMTFSVRMVPSDICFFTMKIPLRAVSTRRPLRSKSCRLRTVGSATVSPMPVSTSS